MNILKKTISGESLVKSQLRAPPLRITIKNSNKAIIKIIAIINNNSNLLLFIK